MVGQDECIENLTAFQHLVPTHFDARVYILSTYPWKERTVLPASPYSTDEVKRFIDEFKMGLINMGWVDTGFSGLETDIFNILKIPDAQGYLHAEREKYLDIAFSVTAGTEDHVRQLRGEILQGLDGIVNAYGARFPSALPLRIDRPSEIVRIDLSNSP